ncbi:hypothetical protein PGTUg99_027558 [Puccinia graminis f. sp. tritici]|uniref:DUF6589 domain-containing protein n=1 Tax=Puccinia graminis f. sp. tritici TaxID=56615 RepID=A0A5B0RM02_PUCGR|nr:hypothetical protein PGTUg99_027558 [Puccinia graminis f. sp. tritici]
MVEEHMPFLFNLISHKLSKTIAKPIPSKKPKASNPQIDIDSDSGLDDDKSEDEDGKEQPQHHYERRLVSCKSRLYVGFDLKELGKHAKEKISKRIANSKNDPIAPFLCIDTLDFEEHVHTKSLGKSIPAADLNLQSYISAMEKIKSVQVTPSMLTGSKGNEEHWVQVLKSQIAKVILEHIASPADKNIKIETLPPTLDQILPEDPDITMLKLMITSENSAQGIGDVCTGILQQSDIKPHNFFNCLQIINGGLATCSNISSLQSQRIPGLNEQDSLCQAR